MATKPAPTQNQLLAALPPADYARIGRDLELIPIPLEWAVYGSGGQMGFTHCAITRIVLLL
jgi:hypothetical protein